MKRNGRIGSAVAVSLALAASAFGQARVAWLDLEGTPREQPDAFAWLAGPNADPTLSDMLRTLDDIASDKDIDGVLIRVKDASLNLAQIEELGDGIARLRESGKRVDLFAENYTTPEILLGSYTDSAIMQSGCALIMPGLYMEEMFLADALRWVGIEPDFVQVGDYKGASEMMARSEPSKEWDQNISSLLDSRYANIRSVIMKGRGLTSAQLDDAMARAWLADSEQAEEMGLIDSAVDLPALKEHLGGLYEDEVKYDYDYEFVSASESIDLSNPFTMLSKLSKPPKHKPKGPTIAVLHIEGTIVDGESRSSSAFSGSQTGSRTTRNAIEQILKEDDIEGVIVRINSPGGSAIASEVIWQGLQRLASEKPVWVSVGSMAASGGYYISVGGERIFVDEASIVGSIGVVGGKLAMGGLYDKVHVNVVTRTRGPLGGIMGSATPWTDSERALVRKRMTETYDLFAKRVTQGREGIDISRVGEGRLFTGDQAIENGMADEIGGLDDAVRSMADAQGMSRYSIMHYPGPKSFDELLEEMLGGIVEAPGVEQQWAGLAKMAIGDDAWPVVRDGIERMMLLRNEPVLLTMPRVLIWK